MAEGTSQPAAAPAPNSFADPYWTQLASATTDKLGLPPGLLSAIVTRGERTNADQVSSAGAKSPFQIIPATRAAALDKYGIDAYLSPQNAAEVAGLLLKDSLTRNQGSIPQAVAEYHGGTDPSKWGPKTQAYVQRVTGAPLAATPMKSPAPPFTSTFDRIMAQRQDQQATNSIANIFAAYQGGQMSPDERAQFEQDVQAGKIMLPQGAALQPAGGAGTSGHADSGAQQVAAGGTVPPGVLQAFARGQMTPQEMGDFEADVRSGKLQLPPGMDADALLGPADKPLGILDKLARIPSALHEAITGDQRRLASTEALPDWSQMPEMNQLSGAGLKTGLGTLTAGPAQSAEIIKANFPGVQVTQDAKGNPILTSSIDGKQYAIKPGFRGLDDAVRGLGGIGEFVLANELVPGSGARGLLPNIAREGVVGGVGGAAIQGQQAATGGTFDPSEVAVSAGLGALGPVVGAGVRGAVTPAQALLTRMRGGAAAPATDAAAEAAGAAAPAGQVPPAAATNTAPATGAARMPGEPEIPITVDAQGLARTPADQFAAGQPSARPATPAPEPVVKAAATGGPSVQDIAQTARAAAGGSKQATKDLAGMAAPDTKTTEAAKRLGIEDYLQPDHVTSSDAYRQVLGVLKSNPTSELALGEKEGLAQVGKRASDLIDEIGGTNDVSGLSADLKSQMTSAHASASALEDKAWQDLRAAIPARQPAPAPATLDFLQKRLDDLGGDVKSLTPMERDILARASSRETVAAAPKATGQQAVHELGDVVTPAQLKAWRDQVSESGVMAGQGIKPRPAPMPEPVVVTTHPTYARIDDLRKEVGAAARMQGPFSDADTGLAKKYYSLLTQDQEAAAGAGNVDLVQQAKAATGVRKGMEDDLTALFGKKLDQSMAPDLTRAMRTAGQGDPSGLVNLLKSTPQNMRQQVVATGMGTVFRNAATRGDISFNNFGKWWGNLERNKTAYNAVMSNLPAAAQKQIADLATVSRAIDLSMQARIKTGLRSSVLDELNVPDTIAARLFDIAKHAGKGLAADAVGGHGAGMAMGLFSALKGGAKPSAVKQLDALLTSPEFVQMARAAGTPQQAQAVKVLANSKPFARFAAAVGKTPALTNRERFILNAIQGAHTTAGGRHVSH